MAKKKKAKNPNAVALGRLGGLKGGKARIAQLTSEGATRTCAQSGSSEMGKREGAQTKTLGIPNIILVPGLDFLSHTHLQTYQVKDACLGRGK